MSFAGVSALTSLRLSVCLCFLHLRDEVGPQNASAILDSRLEMETWTVTD